MQIIGAHMSIAKGWDKTARRRKPGASAGGIMSAKRT